MGEPCAPGADDNCVVRGVHGFSQCPQPLETGRSTATAWLRFSWVTQSRADSGSARSIPIVVRASPGLLRTPLAVSRACVIRCDHGRRTTPLADSVPSCVGDLPERPLPAGDLAEFRQMLWAPPAAERLTNTVWNRVRLRPSRVRQYTPGPVVPTFHWDWEYPACLSSTFTRM